MVINSDFLISIVEDEVDIAELISLHLTRNNYKVMRFENAGDFFQSITENDKIPDLVILDLMLPDMDGIDICKKLKSDPASRDIAVIMVTARQDETDKIVGLEVGADDYITKPFSPRELVARVKAVLRRVDKNVLPATVEEQISINNLIFIDTKKYKVYNEYKEEVILTLTEFKILELLALKRGLVFSREKILESVWGDSRYVVDRTVDVHIRHLREKLGDAGDLIKNVRGVGYKIDDK